MSQWKNVSRRGYLFLILLVLSLFVFSEETAEARRRRGGFRRAVFGRRAQPAPRRRGVARNFNRVNNFRFNDIDRLALARRAVDPFSNLALDPTGDLSRLAGLSGNLNGRGLRRIASSNIAVNDQGQFFEQFDSDLLSTDRPLVFNDGKILGGAIVPLRNDTLEQVRQLNAADAFRGLSSRGFGRRGF